MARRFVIVLLVLLTFGSCPTLASAAGNGRKTLKIVYVDWDCAVASSNFSCMASKLRTISSMA